MAAFSVLLFHVWWFTADEGRLAVGARVDGVVSFFWLGVSVFFVLSGFLLYRPFAAASIQRSPWPSLRKYARSRALRIVPAYWLVLTLFVLLVERELRLGPFVLLVFAGLLLYHPAVIASLRGASAGVARRYAFTVATHVCVVGFVAHQLVDDPGLVTSSIWPSLRNYLFLNVTQTGWAIVPAWTLAIEVSFYAVLPVVAIAIDRCTRSARTPARRMVRQLTLLAPLVAVTIAYSSLHAHVAPSLPDRVLPMYVGEFALGMVLAAFAAWRGSGDSGTSRFPTAWIFVTAGVTVAAVATSATPWKHDGAVSYELVMATSFALVIAGVVLPRRPGMLIRLLRLRPLMTLGEISYGVYLWHFPLLVVLRALDVVTVGGIATFALNAAIVVTLTLIAASASWRYVERPLLQLKNRSSLPPAGTGDFPASAPAVGHAATR